MGPAKAWEGGMHYGGLRILLNFPKSAYLARALAFPNQSFDAIFGRWRGAGGFAIQEADHFAWVF